MPLVKILVSRFEGNFFLKNLILAPPKSRKNVCCANFLKFSQISICKPIELSITKKRHPPLARIYMYCLCMYPTGYIGIERVKKIIGQILGTFRAEKYFFFTDFPQKCVPELRRKFPTPPAILVLLVQFLV